MTHNSYRESYLNLLADCLCFELWDEPLKPLNCTARSGFGIRVLRGLDRFLRRYRLALAIVPIQSEEPTYWPVLAHTMIGRDKLRNIRSLCSVVEDECVPGSWVECGVWRGGASIYARACLDVRREVVCCDSFCGLPKDDTETQYSEYDLLRVSESEVRKNFEKYHLHHNVRFMKGYFSESLPHFKGPISILRADGDMYSSTMDILENLEPRVVRGGFVIIDDWWLPMCRSAVEYYRAHHNISSTIVDIDGYAVYWRKE